MNALIELSRQYDRQIIALLFSIPRIYAFFAASQLLNSSVVPGMARHGVVMALMLFVAPLNLEYAEHFDRSPTFYALLFGKEYAIGFLLGNVVGWVFWAVNSAGAFIDNQRGTAIASSIDPMHGDESSLLGNLFSFVFVTYVFITASVLPLLGVLYQSFALWPISHMGPILSPAFPSFLLKIFDYAMLTMFNLAAPIIAVMFVAEFSLAIVSRFAPQVQVFILAMPIKSLIAIMMLLFYSAIMIEYASSLLSSGRGNAVRLYEILKEGEGISRGGNDAKEPPE